MAKKFPEFKLKKYKAMENKRIKILEDRITLLEECLRWYIENDDVNLSDPTNEYYIEGYNKAKEALKKKEQNA